MWVWAYVLWPWLIWFQCPSLVTAGPKECKSPLKYRASCRSATESIIHLWWTVQALALSINCCKWASDASLKHNKGSEVMLYSPWDFKVLLTNLAKGAISNKAWWVDCKNLISSKALWACLLFCNILGFVNIFCGAFLASVGGFFLLKTVVVSIWGGL